MFGKSKGQKPRKRQPNSEEGRGKTSLSQLGFLEMPNVSNLALGGNNNDDDDEDDDDFEAELLALTSGSSDRPRPSVPKRARKGVDADNLNKMVSECMNDDSNDDEVDEDDPELLAELSALGSGDENEKNFTCVSDNSESISSPGKSPPTIVRPSPFLAGASVTGLLEERIEMYKLAEENALTVGDSSRAKRFGRGLKTLKQLLKNVQAGKPINEDEIPPPVLVQSSRTNSARNLNEDNVEPAAPNSPSTIPHDVAFQDTSPDSHPLSREAASNEVSSTEASSTPVSISEGRVSSKPVPQSTPTLPVDNLPPPTHSQTNGTSSPPLSLPKCPEKSNQIPCPSPIVKSGPCVPSSPNVPSLPVEPSSYSPHQPLTTILRLQKEYKVAALNAKKNGSKEDALGFMRIAKQLEPLIMAAKEGKPVNMESLPPQPGKELVQDFDKGKDNLEKSPESGKQIQTNPIQSEGPANNPAPAATAESSPSTQMEALEQRLAKYIEQRDKAKAEGNARKQRMNERIMKQYQEAMKELTLGRHVDFNELPTPPGFPPIPGGQKAGSPGPPLEPSAASPTSGPSEPKPNNSTPQANQLGTAQVVKPTPPARQNVRKDPKSMVERQLSILQRRQDQFKVAALEAKKKGEVEQAKEYLRNSKGIEKLVAVTQGGLPVDMNTVPIPPQEKLSCEDMSIDFELVDKEDCISAPPTTPADIAVTFTKLEEDLIQQIKMCARTREHFKALGDVASANRFEQLIIHTKKDLDAVRAAFKRGDKPPRFYYENRTFTMIQCNTDLNDSDCEVIIVRGINFNVANPADVDTYIKIEFPYPSDAPPQDRTSVVKDTNNPEFNHKIMFSIDRKARALSRVFKRHAIKCQVIAKGGWFHRDSLLGNVKIPLVPLETKCTLHDSFDLIDDKKKMVGGKLEVKVRVRNPILSKQLEKVTEKWIVIGGF